MNSTATKLLELLGSRLGRFSHSELMEATGFTAIQVTDGLKTLKRRGFAHLLWRGCHKVTPEGLHHLETGKGITSGPNGPRTMSDETGGNFRSRLWRALRLSKKGSVPELLVLATRGSEGNAEDNAKTYLEALTRAGILIRMSMKGVNGRTRYLLIRDTGPLAPQWNKRQKRIFDPNTGETLDVT